MLVESLIKNRYSYHSLKSTEDFAQSRLLNNRKYNKFKYLFITIKIARKAAMIDKY